MAKFKPYNPDQVTLLPISLQNQIVPGSLEHTINELVENHIDLSLFDRRYKNDATGAYAINPKILLKIILLAYSRGLISSRQMERACRENATFMALCSSYFPDHSTIASFVSSMQNEIENVFCNVLLVCDELGLLGGTHFSLDGVKLSANVSKEWSGTFDELKHKRDKLQQKLEQVLAEHIQTDQQPELELEHQKEQERRLQLQVERLNQFIENEKPKIGSEGKEIQSNAVDNQSVKMPTSHGVVQGYNAQALVDSKHQVILVAEAFSSQDHENLEPMIKGAKKNAIAIGKSEAFFQEKQLTADSNYHSFESLSFCKNENIDAYIPDIQFRKRDQRFNDSMPFGYQQRFRDGIHSSKSQVSRADRFTAADFSFDPANQVYICPQGKRLTCHARNQTNRYRTYDIYHARQEDCAACPLRARCLSKADSSRRYISVQVDSQPPNVIDEMKTKIDSPQGKKIYARRLGIVEPVFANICVQKRMDRFTLRSKLKVDIQWRLFALVHNIGKIHSFGAIQ
jgi:transposase